MARRIPFSEEDLSAAIAESECWVDVLRFLGYVPKGSNFKTVKKYRGRPHPSARKVPRPSHNQLQADLSTMSYCAVGRKYGVSDNAIRKWLRWYERQLKTEGSPGGERSDGGSADTIAA